jgi:chromosome segregation protein
LENFESLKETVRRVVGLIKKIMNDGFESGEDQEKNQKDVYEEEIKKAVSELKIAEEKLSECESKEQKIKSTLSQLRQKLEEDKSTSLEAEKKIISLMSEKNELQNIISEFAIAEDVLQRDSEMFQNELRESVALVGRQVLDYESLEFDIEDDRQTQIDRRKKLERMKIKVEETVGYTSDETLKEYDEVTERDAFLIKEIEDLENSAGSLNRLIKDLEEQIEIKFKEGLNKINNEFNNFFSLMFGGGRAGLKLVKIPARRKKDSDLIMSESGDDFEEEQEAEEGVDIFVDLPRKKIKDMMMLSGGERALTSIALLFAISQVNPPPFIILDETDAALDEANSRKYGDMIENLSKYSQLILITHNRETMSRAGVLYGVTMIQGSSQLLSIAFEEGIEYAK